MATFSSFSKIAGLKAGLLPPIGTMLMLSVPPAIITSASPRRMRSAASATAWTPEEQKRLIVIPDTRSGKPASRSPMRATFMPCSPSGIAQPTMTSSTSPGSSPWHCWTAALSTCASRSSGRTFLYMPRGALPTGVRVAATMYASWICLAISIPQWLARLEHVLDPRLRLFRRDQLHERLALEIEEPLLVDEAAGFDLAAAHHGREL